MRIRRVILSPAFAILFAALQSHAAETSDISPEHRQKSVPSLVSEEERAVIKENIATYDWAQKIRDKAVKAASKAEKLSCEQLAKYVPDPRIPRDGYVQENECPNCGLALRKFGLYSWIITEEAPYKVKCPNCGKIYPDNNYQSFVDSGFTDRSSFSGSIVDNGTGWESPKYPGHKYWFVAYWNHWMAQRRMSPAIENLAKAYLYTGEDKYAYKCATLLWQMAMYYPDYDYVNQSRHGIEYDRNYFGKLFYYTWECFNVQTCSQAYDEIFPALLKADPELEQFTGKSMKDVRYLIEEQLLRSMAREIVNETHVIGGNFGMHQTGLLQVAATLKDTTGKPSSEEMVDWVLNNKEYKLYIYMPLYDALYNLIYRDGVPFESPSYNLHWIEDLTKMANMLKLSGVDVYKEPRFKRLYDWGLDLVCAGNFTPALGDAGNMSERGKFYREDLLLNAYKAYGDPLYAKLILELNPVNAGCDISSKPMTKELREAASKVSGAHGYASRHLPGYGLATLQNNSPAHPIALSLFYGRFVGHAHRDRMQLDIFAENASLIPDFGYPETANSSDPRRAGFFDNTVSHNTVVVDRKKQSDSRGRCLVYDTGDICQYVEAENYSAYPGVCTNYNRSTAMITPSDEKAYLIDIFRVQGGSQHDWLVHGTHADVQTTIPLSAPRGGTLAGENVAYGYYYDNPRLAAAPAGTINYNSYTGSGFQFLYNVQEGELPSEATVTWNVITSGPRAFSLISANPGAYLKAFLIGKDEQIFLCDGKPQQNRKDSPESVKFLVRRKTGENLKSTFITVFEPGAGAELIKSVTPVGGFIDDLTVLKIEFFTGEVDYYFNALTPVQEITLENGIRFAGKAGCLSLDKTGGVKSAWLAGGSSLAHREWRLMSPPTLEAVIAACNYTNGSVTISTPVPPGYDYTGKTIAIDSGEYGSSFVVTGIASPSDVLFSNQSPIAARATITAADGQRKTLTTSTVMHFLRPGMTVVNEDMQVIGKVDKFENEKIYLKSTFDPALVSDHENSGVKRVFVMEYGPGDTIRMPTSARYQKQ
ncbi:MAG: heparinase II/III family protein [Verrucomicrobia bacterium]|nr:heparinase II/III family protein [Verrucomicrobiota bacterium]